MFLKGYCRDRIPSLSAGEGRPTPDGIQIPRAWETDFPNNPTLAPLLRSYPVGDVLRRNTSSFPSFAWTPSMRLERLRCATNLSTPPKHLLEIPDTSSRMIRIEVAKVRAVLHLSRMSGDPHITQSQKMPRGDFNDLQRIEFLRFRRS